MSAHTIILCCFQEKVDVAVAQERVGCSNLRIAVRKRTHILIRALSLSSSFLIGVKSVDDCFALK